MLVWVCLVFPYDWSHTCECDKMMFNTSQCIHRTTTSKHLPFYAVSFLLLLSHYQSSNMWEDKLDYENILLPVKTSGCLLLSTDNSYLNQSLWQLPLSNSIILLFSWNCTLFLPIHLKQLFSTFLALGPFSRVHVVVISNLKIILLILHNCNLASNHNPQSVNRIFVIYVSSIEFSFLFFSVTWSFRFKFP